MSQKIIKHIEQRIATLKEKDMEFENAERLDELESLLRWVKA